MKTTCLLIATAILLVSCNKEETTTATTTPASTAPSASLSQVFGTAPAGEPQAIPIAKTTAKPGDEITLSGKIMGSSKPFVEGRAVFILGDPAVLTPCNEKPGDDCDTPWDTCCDSREDKKRGTATIQVLGPDGRVLSEAIQGVGGLEHLAAVTVTGEVAEGSSADLLIINATAIRANQ